MTALRQRLLEDMQLRQLSPFTQRAYVASIAQFARHTHLSTGSVSLHDPMPIADQRGSGSVQYGLAHRRDDHRSRRGLRLVAAPQP